MEKGFEEKLQHFQELVHKIKYYNEALSVIFWDLRTGAPKKGVPSRAKVIGMLSTESFKLSTSEEMEDCLHYFEQEENNSKLDHIYKAVVKECRKEYDRSKKIPEAMYKEYVILTSEAESIWEEAKNTDNFLMFSPYLEKIVDFNIKFIDLWGYKDNKYNTLLDYYEPGMTVEKLDRIFEQLRERIVPLVQNIKNSPYQPDDSMFFKNCFDTARQEEFSLMILDKMGYSFDAGRLDVSEHPFTIGMCPGDVRITTHYYQDNFISALFSSIHEGGHALYEQNISTELEDTPVGTASSMGIHESQSRLWENIIGRSRSFWSCYIEDLHKIFPEEFKGVSLEDFYKAINKVAPSLIRTDADEVTYNLHVMIRYEIEKALINKEIKVADLPEIWKEKMKEYLGIEPNNDREGVLQDVHWSGGSFGYFPSYTLGNIYSAQIYNAIRKQFNNLDEMIKNGELTKIKDWLGENIHKHGKLLTPAEILKSVTGEEINSGYLIDYLESKYKEIYKL
ncbi:MAG: Carboxypeptidase Taq [Clostridia bacterium]|nr:Carboxypeptidase Taq [Clostridia bacterium]